MAIQESLSQQVETIQRQYQQKLPPVQTWNPPLSGEMDMVIQADGQWRHEGDIIQRQSLVNLFSTILKKEGDDYYLVTPVEKWKIQVEDAPFVIVDFEFAETTNYSLKYFTFITSYGDKVVVDKDHPLWVDYAEGQDKPKPYVIVRHDMPGLIHRKVYYQLVDLALKNNEENPGMTSCGEFFSLF